MDPAPPGNVTVIVIAHDRNGKMKYFDQLPGAWDPYSDGLVDGYFDYAERRFEYGFDAGNKDQVTDAKQRSCMSFYILVVYNTY